jgi:2-amino-4-hydroxy-6-hydroxymethyldihydropteridine diphosphokinase
MNNLRQAIDLLTRLPNFALEAQSSYYETEPWGITDQATFLNLVLRGQWYGDAPALLRAGLEIETSLNRVRRVKNGPRTIDVDILLFGAEQHHSNALTVPHPGLYERDFMLLPLLEISPAARDPASGRPLQEFQPDLLYRCIRRPFKEDVLG